MKIKNIIKLLEDYAPLSLAESWDNSGWQVKFDENISVDDVLLTVTITLDVIDYAIKNNFMFIVSHHPLIFPNINKIDDKILIKAIKNNIQIYSLHTNLDKVATSRELASVLDFKDVYSLNDYVVATSNIEVDVYDLIYKIKQNLNIQNFVAYNFNTNKKSYNKIAFCAGSGGDFINDLNDAQLYITSDIKYHQSLINQDLTIFDVGHLNSEQPVLTLLKDLIQSKTLRVKIYNEISNSKIV